MRGSCAIGLVRGIEAARGADDVESGRSSLTRRTAIISCTGNAESERSRLLQCGADEVWDKPVPSFIDGAMQRSVAGCAPWLVVLPRARRYRVHWRGRGAVRRGDAPLPPQHEPQDEGQLLRAAGQPGAARGRAQEVPRRVRRADRAGRRHCHRRDLLRRARPPRPRRHRLPQHVRRRRRRAPLRRHPAPRLRRLPPAGAAGGAAVAQDDGQGRGRRGRQPAGRRREERRGAGPHAASVGEARRADAPHARAWRRALHRLPAADAAHGRRPAGRAALPRRSAHGERAGCPRDETAA